MQRSKLLIIKSVVNLIFTNKKIDVLTDSESLSAMPGIKQTLS